MRSFPCGPAIFDSFTDSKTSRPELDTALEQVRKGEGLVITRLDHLGRSTKDLLAVVGDVEVNGVPRDVPEQRIDTSASEGKMFFTMAVACAEFDCEIMR